MRSKDFVSHKTVGQCPLGGTKPASPRHQLAWFCHPLPFGSLTWVTCAPRLGPRCNSRAKLNPLKFPRLGQVDEPQDQPSFVCVRWTVCLFLFIFFCFGQGCVKRDRFYEQRLQDVVRAVRAFLFPCFFQSLLFQSLLLRSVQRANTRRTTMLRGPPILTHTQMLASAGGCRTVL